MGTTPLPIFVLGLTQLANVGDSPITEGSAVVTALVLLGYLIVTERRRQKNGSTEREHDRAIVELRTRLNNLETKVERLCDRMEGV